MSQRGPDRTSLPQLRFDSTLQARGSSYRRDEEQQLTDDKSTAKEKEKKQFKNFKNKQREQTVVQIFY